MRKGDFVSIQSGTLYGVIVQIRPGYGNMHFDIKLLNGSIVTLYDECLLEVVSEEEIEIAEIMET